MRLIAIWFALTVALGQDSDPLPPQIHIDLIKAHRNQLAAEGEKRELMIKYHAAELKYESALHTIRALSPLADGLCGEKRRFDLDLDKCVGK